MKKLPVFIFLIALAFGACKKGSKNALKPLTPADKINAMLTAGNGTWQIATQTETYYDSTNNVLQIMPLQRTGFYIFELTDIEEFTPSINPPQDAGTTLFKYALSVENNISYITTGQAGETQTKAKFDVLTDTALTISGTVSQPGAIELNGAVVNPAYAISTLSLVKYTGK